MLSIFARNSVLLVLGLCFACATPRSPADRLVDAERALVERRYETAHDGFDVVARAAESSAVQRELAMRRVIECCCYLDCDRALADFAEYRSQLERHAPRYAPYEILVVAAAAECSGVYGVALELAIAKLHETNARNRSSMEETLRLLPSQFRSLDLAQVLSQLESSRTINPSILVFDNCEFD